MEVNNSGYLKLFSEILRCSAPSISAAEPRNICRSAIVT